VQDNTEIPKIGLKGVLIVKEDFRRREYWCANTAARGMCFRNTSTVARQPGRRKVAKNNVAVRIDKDVLLLYVSMYNIMGMNVLNSKKLVAD